MKKKMLNIKGQRGTAAIEFAILLPVLVLLLFGTIEFGLLLFNKQVITNASREGARAGIVLRDDGRLPLHLSDESEEEPLSIERVVENYCQGNLVTFAEPDETGETDLSVSCTSTADQESGDDLYVTATYNYGFLVLGNIGFDDIVLQAQTVMKYE